MTELNVFNELNKLFCTFTPVDDVNDVVDLISNKYTVLYSKIFILESPQCSELICTYNIDTGNINQNYITNTILMHRKKESNTLYTINALNTLIKSLNNGNLDTNYKVNWSNYQNSILLNNGPEIRHLNTKIFKIIHLS